MDQFEQGFGSIWGHGIKIVEKWSDLKADPLEIGPVKTIDPYS